jgi:hypothetical protein
MNEDQAALIAEKLLHTVDLLKAEIRLLSNRVERLEKDAVDHESRLRALHESATQFKVLAGLASGGGLLSLIGLLRELLK